tara:strand:- start:718 stop:1185 length:468 start_codon:yes stop_codon:yes gene_type:complete
MKYAIIIPAGSGKTTLSRKYKQLYDIDAFHNKEDEEALNNLYREVVISNDWEKYNKYEISLIKDKIEKLSSPFVILLHSKEKADLLDLKYLGSIKICKEIMEKVAKQRGLSSQLREEQTINSWNNCEGKIFESFEDIEKCVIKICNYNNIILNKN